MLDSQYYRSAFAGSLKTTDSFFFQERYAFSDSISDKTYTIQLFTSFHPLEDPILKASHLIRVVRMGELYRYIFSQYDSLAIARTALIRIRQLYPQACIREYQNKKLGQVIDMNIDYRINYKNYDAR